MVKWKDVVKAVKAAKANEQPAAAPTPKPSEAPLRDDYKFPTAEEEAARLVAKLRKRPGNLDEAALREAEKQFIRLGQKHSANTRTGWLAVRNDATRAGLIKSERQEFEELQQQVEELHKASQKKKSDEPLTLDPDTIVGIVMKHAGNLSAVSRDTGIPRRTLGGWVYVQEAVRLIKNDKAERKERLSRTHDDEE
jgi:hypothetical protein